jgi:hypothetical protein
MTGLRPPSRRPAAPRPAGPLTVWARDARPAGAAGVLRRCLLALVGLSAAGTAVELAMLRHWNGPWQLLPWIALAVVAIAAGLLAGRPSRRVVYTVRALAFAVVVCAAAGVYVHVEENYQSGPLDQRYTSTWDTMPAAARWWAALSKTVGPAPPVAPGVLAQAALGLLFATARHPALAHAPE